LGKIPDQVRDDNKKGKKMPKKFDIKYKEQDLEITIDPLEDNKLSILSDGNSDEIEYQKISQNQYLVIKDNQSFDLKFFHDEHGETSIFIDGEVQTTTIIDPIKARREAVGGGGAINLDGPVPIESMMPGKIIAVKVKVGDEVKTDQDIVVLEAMKMENVLKSPKDGKVTEVNVKEGDSVESGTKLVVVE
jgi:biotin carboxyl carrier protein